MVAEAIAALDVPVGARVLDIGPGAGGALPLLAAAAGPTGSVLGVDLNPAVVPLAAEHAGPVADVRAGNALEVLDDERFDLIWAGDVVWPGNFADPGATVAALIRGLRPGGTLALLTSGYYRASFLPGYGRLGLLVRLVSFLRSRLPADGPRQHDRLLGWVHTAGASDPAVRVLPRIGFPDEPAVRSYLQGAVWPEMRRSAAEHGHEVGLTDTDLADLTALTTPGGPRYVVDEPGYHVVQPALLVTARRPAS